MEYYPRDTAIVFVFAYLALFLLHYFYSTTTFGTSLLASSGSLGIVTYLTVAPAWRVSFLSCLATSRLPWPLRSGFKGVLGAGSTRTGAKTPQLDGSRVRMRSGRAARRPRPRPNNRSAPAKTKQQKHTEEWRLLSCAPQPPHPTAVSPISQP